MKAKRSFGFYLVAISTILSIAGLVLYRKALMQTSMTNTLLICAIAAGVCALLAALATGKEISNILCAAHVILVIAAISVSIAPMVNEIGLVYAGLNPQSNLTGYLHFAIVTCIGWIIGLVSTFTGIIQKN
ncbi:MAG: hypothetical protein IJI45_02355 [Anaerolineaceae bacterium]|nr:hypothetical protein [Anaerolineaceae bacterium]